MHQAAAASSGANDNLAPESASASNATTNTKKPLLPQLFCCGCEVLLASSYPARENTSQFHTWRLNTWMHSSMMKIDLINDHFPDQLGHIVLVCYSCTDQHHRHETNVMQGSYGTHVPSWQCPHHNEAGHRLQEATKTWMRMEVTMDKTTTGQ